MNRSTYYNTGRHQQREGGASRNLLRHTAQRQVVRPMEFRGGSARRGIRKHSSGGWRAAAAAGRTNPRGTLQSYPTIPDHATQRPQPRTNCILLTFPNNDWNDNHFRTGHACGSGTAQLVAAVMLRWLGVGSCWSRFCSFIWTSRRGLLRASDDQ